MDDGIIHGAYFTSMCVPHAKRCSRRRIFRDGTRTQADTSSDRSSTRTTSSLDRIGISSEGIGHDQTLTGVD